MKPILLQETDAFDFRREDRVPASQLAVARSLEESFVRRVAASLADYLRSTVSGSLVSVEQADYDTFAGELEQPACMAWVSMCPYEGFAAMALAPALVGPLVDLVLGGTGEAGAAPGREVTDLEQSILEGVFKVMLRDLTATWQQVVRVEFEMDSLETRPAAPRIPAKETVLVYAMELRIRETVSGIVKLAIPALTLKAMGRHFESPRAAGRDQTADSGRAIQEKLARKLAVNVGARLNGASLRLRDLWSLEPGKVIDLRKPVGTPVDVTINGKPMLKGELVEVGGKQAVQASSRIERAGDDVIG